MSGQLRLALAGAIATATAALSLHTVFAGWHWLGPVLGVVVLVIGTTAAARSARLPSVLQPLAAAVVVLLWITLLDARSVAVDGIFPGPGAFRQLRVVTRNGLDDVHRLATPVPTHRGVVLLAVLGVAAVALVVDLLVVQLRRVALAGLPLLGLFATCAGVGHHGAGVLAFIVSAAGFLWLLFVDSRERITRWGTSVTTGESQRRRGIWTDIGTDPAATDTATALGRRIGGAAIGLGVVVPLLVPGLHTGIGHRHSGGGGGGHDIVTVNPIVSIASDLQSKTPITILSYRSSVADPGYLRLTSLDLLNGGTFSASALQADSKARVDGPVPGITQPSPTSAVRPVVTTVTISKALTVHWLPVEAQATNVKVNGDWLYDQASGTIFSAGDSTSDQQYTATSVPVDPTPGQLTAAGRPGPALAGDLVLPRDISPKVRQLTRQITKQARSPYADAIAIQNFLAGGHRFSYDTSIPPDTSPNALADFLLDSRRGFCQQFATAMAVMARMMDIPARVAVGFTHGIKAADGSWVVTTADAHAWPELWFQGVGWVPFEPTPRTDGQAVTPLYANGTSTKTNTPGGGVSGGGPRTNPLQQRNRQRTQGPTGGSKAARDAGGSQSGGGLHTPGSLWLRLLLLAAVAALVLPAALRLALRRRRRHLMTDPLAAASAAWAELRATALDFHAPWDDLRSPRQAAAGIARVLPNDRGACVALTRVALAEEAARYARDPRPEGVELWTDVDRVGAALRARLRTARRWRFRVFPRSLLVAVRPLVWRVADVLDGLDAWIGRSRRLLRRHA
jgi:transglutaminase-like putative cysteine protease